MMNLINELRKRVRHACMLIITIQYWRVDELWRHLYVQVTVYSVFISIYTVIHMQWCRPTVDLVGYTMNMAPYAYLNSSLFMHKHYKVIIELIVYFTSESL